KLLVERRDAVSDVPADRWNVERYYDREPAIPGKTFVKRGGFLDQSTSSIRSFSAFRRAKLLTSIRSIVCCSRRHGKRSKTRDLYSTSRKEATSRSSLAFRTMIIRESKALLSTISVLRPIPPPAARTLSPRIGFPTA